jgi:hypothetical protein
MFRGYTSKEVGNSISTAIAAAIISFSYCRTEPSTLSLWLVLVAIAILNIKWR